MKRDNYILIGMPGVGKSTAGVILAKILGYKFIDSDLLIQEHTGLLLKEIIAKYGDEGFLKIENDINKNIETFHSVIATGGSVVYSSEAMEHLKSIGTVIYLKLPYDLLSTRLSNLTARGVVLKPDQSLMDLYKERTILYEKYADFTIDETNLTVEETINSIIKETGC